MRDVVDSRGLLMDCLRRVVGSLHGKVGLGAGKRDCASHVTQSSHPTGTQGNEVQQLRDFKISIPSTPYCNLFKKKQHPGIVYLDNGQPTLIHSP